MANPLAGLTPAELAQTPALMPPPGMVSNFINPPGTLEAVTNATMAVCFTFTTIFVFVRLLTKYCVDRAFQWEDCQYSLDKEISGAPARKKADFCSSGCCLVAWVWLMR